MDERDFIDIIGLQDGNGLVKTIERQWLPVAFVEVQGAPDDGPRLEVHGEIQRDHNDAMASAHRLCESVGGVSYGVRLARPSE